MKISLVHGFSGSPEEMEFIRKELEGMGEVENISLPGHSGSYDDLSKVRYYHWIEYVEEKCEETHFIGFSLGALLGIILGSKKRVKSLVLISTPIVLPDWRIKLSPLAGIFRRFPVEVCGVRVPAGGVHEFLRVRNIAIGVLGDITLPTLILHGKMDKMALPSSSRIVYERIRSKRKKLVIIEEGEHILPYIEKTAMEIKEWIKSLKEG